MYGSVSKRVSATLSKMKKSFHIGLERYEIHQIYNTCASSKYLFFFLISLQEIIAGMLDIGPERWRRPKYHQESENRARQRAFLKDWEQWDWTASLPT